MRLILIPAMKGASCKTNGSALEYSLAYSPEDFLEGLSTDPLIASAKANGSWEVDDTLTTVTAGQDVKVKGTATISKAILEAEPYNLIYNSTSGLYYKDANGNQVADIGEEVNDLDKWKAALGLDALSAVPTVTGRLINSFRIFVFPASHSQSHCPGNHLYCR